MVKANMLLLQRQGLCVLRCLIFFGVFVLNSALPSTTVLTLTVKEEKVCYVGDDTCVPDTTTVAAVSDKSVFSNMENGTVQSTSKEKKLAVAPRELMAENGPYCVDTDESCSVWAEDGECTANPSYMDQFCPKSCNTCSGVYVDVYRRFLARTCFASFMKSSGKGRKQNSRTSQRVLYYKICFKEYAEHFKSAAAKSLTEFGDPQKVQKGDDATIEVIADTKRYMLEEVINPEFDFVWDSCLNRHEMCAFWASTGECDNNPSYMFLNCAPSCQTCQVLDIKVRCPLDPDAVDVFQPGDLHKMFERIVAEVTEKQLYDLQILSRPSGGKSLDDVDTLDGPWVITLDNFISPEECDRLIELGAREGYQRSMDIGPLKFDGSYEDLIYDDRTSENAWCIGECLEDPIAANVMMKIVNLTGVPEPNCEQLQLLKYEVGQYYKVHHDFIDYQVDRPSGPRILTVFLYLNDVEAGGGTNFPILNDLTVMPKKGRVLIWPSSMDHNLNESDERTYHQALPVEKGRKYGANSWLHLRDYQTPNEKGCT